MANTIYSILLILITISLTYLVYDRYYAQNLHEDDTDPPAILKTVTKVNERINQQLIEWRLNQREDNVYENENISNLAERKI